MKKIISVFCLFLLICHLSSVYSQNEWTVIGCKPEQFNYNDLHCFSNNDLIIAGNVGNILITKNAGLNWTHNGYVSNFYGSLNKMFFLGETGWCACDSGVVLKTFNRGNNWIKYYTNTGLNLSDIFFINSLTGYATSSIQLIKTINGGINWSLIYQPCNGWINSPFFINENTGWMVGGGCAGPYCFNNLLKTTNSGLNWTEQYGNRNIYKLKFFDENTGYMVAGSGTPAYVNSLFLKTTNSGTNWTIQYVDDSTYHFSDMDFFDKNTGWLFGWSFIYKTTNAGTNWIKFNNSPGNLIKVVDNINSWSIDTYSPRIFHSTNSSYSWDTVSHSIPGLGIGKIFFLNENTGWGISFSEIYKTSDGGFNWKIYPVPNSRNIGDIVFLDENTGFVTSIDKQTDTVYLYKSTNGGENWSYVNINFKIYGLYQIKYFTPSNLVLIGGNYNASKAIIIKSSDSGENWTLDTLDDSYSIIIGDYNNIWAVKTNKLIKTIDGGAHWQQINVPGISAFGFCSFMNQNIGIVTTYSGNFPVLTYIHRTFDGGITWDSVFTGLSGFYQFNSLFFNNAVSWYTAVDNYYIPIVIKVTNNLSNWNVFRLPGNNSQYSLRSIFFINENTGWISGGIGQIYKTSNGGITFISKNEYNIPSNFSLSQNFPNPFNPSTNIRYEIPKNGFVKLVVFDILGREIQTLVNEKQNAGTYEVTFNARHPGLGSNFSSGIYFYTLSVGEYKVTKKFVLLK